MTIEILRREDVPACLDIISSNYNKLYAQFAAIELDLTLTTNPYRPLMYVYKDRDKIIGLGGYSPVFISWNVYTLVWVNTHQEHQRKGVAKGIVTKCLSDLESLSSIVVIATTVPSYYEKHFEFKRMTTYIGEGKVNTIMEKHLGSE